MAEEATLFQHLSNHPVDCQIFSEWLICEDDFRDNGDGTYKIHRKLTVREGANHPIDEIANLIIKHHILPERIDSISKKKRILDKYAFNDYVEKQHLIPRNRTTQRGNLGEILLGEYLEKVTDNKLYIYRLRYNPNVEQSMKGDDVLLLNEENPYSKVYTGESKFRTRPDKSAVDELCKEYGKDIVRPLSIGFTINLFYSMGKIDEAELLEELLYKIANNEVEIINVGLLLSNQNASRNIENHMISKHPKFGAISMNIVNPDVFSDTSFDYTLQSLRGEHDEE